MIIYVLLFVLVICLCKFFPNAKKIQHKEIFRNIDPECNNYAKKGCSLPGKISNTCYGSNLLNNQCNKERTAKKCGGPSQMGAKCFDKHYELCISSS